MHIPPHPKFHPQCLYVRVVKAKEVDVSGCYVEVRLGNYKETTRPLTLSDPDWNQVFAFDKVNGEAAMLEVTVKDTDALKDDFKGWVLYDLSQIPKTVLPDTPEWYRLRDRIGEEIMGEVMLAVWWGTQPADEAAIVARVVDGPASVGSKVYYSPRLWYLRVNVIEAKALMPSDQTRIPQVYVKATLGHQALRTSVSRSNSINPMWNEDLMFVAAEPFEEPLILSVENYVAPNDYEVLGRCAIPIQYVDRMLDQNSIAFKCVDRRFDHKSVPPARWFNLEKYVRIEGQQTEQAKFASWIHMRICLEGAYHVFDESIQYSSDLRPVAKQLWNKSIGILELGIMSADGLSPMKTKDGRATTDAYCVAKYGPKWVRTKTILDSFTPEWNEQYTWEVYDPCTVITVGVFDNFHSKGGDTRIGKVRIRVSTLEPGRAYNHSYPLLVLHPSGVKKMGEINLSVRFTCLSLVNMMHMYSRPLLPEIHYIHPFSDSQFESLTHQATQIVVMRLGRGKPPLTKEVVEYMLDVGCDLWSIRRTKANISRIVRVFDDLFAVGRWFGKNPIHTFIIFFILGIYPELILSLFFFSLFAIGVWNYRHRPRYPPHMDARLSCADNADPEEFNTFPTCRPVDFIRTRQGSSRRSIYGRIQIVVGETATQLERFQSLLSWRDP